MKILSLDTSTPCGSVAISNGAKFCAELEYRAESSHAEVLLQVIDNALKKAGLEISDIDCFAVAIGPGSFTGLRIGVATAKGLAFALNKPIVGISSLEALALNPPSPPFIKGGLGEIFIVPCINAYRGEVYTAVVSGQWPVASEKYLLRECSIAPEALCDLLRRGGALSPPNSGGHGDPPLLFIGDGALQYKELFEEKLGKRFILAKGKTFPIAKEVGQLAMQRLERGENDDAGALAPNYIRKSDAELKAHNALSS